MTITASVETIPNRKFLIFVSLFGNEVGRNTTGWIHTSARRLYFTILVSPTEDACLAKRKEIKETVLAPTSHPQRVPLPACTRPFSCARGSSAKSRSLPLRSRKNSASPAPTRNNSSLRRPHSPAHRAATGFLFSPALHPHEE